MFFSLLLLIPMACGQLNEKAVAELNNIVKEVRRQYAPDVRDEVYDIRLVDNNGRLTVKGVTTVDEARMKLLQQLHDTYGRAVNDSIILLPDPALGDDVRYGVVNVSVANVRMGADYAAEMGTQLLLGAPVQVLQHDDWWRIKSAEGYIAWITGSSFVCMSKEAFNQWTAARKIIFTDIYGFAYESADAGRHVSDLVFGNLLRYEGEEGAFYKVAYPDGRRAYVSKSQAVHYDEWLSSVSLTEESIIRKALTLRGVPYSWGGTSTKAVDCSGFSKTVFLMHGVILRRDASQQAKTGIPVDISEGYDQLRPGDLMFFGVKEQDGKKERVRHVGIYMGDREFIHSIGYVRVGSLDSTRANYDEHNTREFIRAARVIGAVGAEGIWRIDQNPLYREQE